MMASLSLLALIVGLVVWPARHVLLPLWPVSVYEVLSSAGEGSACCALVSRSHIREGSVERLTVLGRPISLSCLEFDDDGLQCGYLLGLRREAGAPLLDEIPGWIDQPLVDFEDERDWILVLALPGDERLEVSLGQIKRMFRPNALTLSQRMALASERFVELISARSLNG